MKPAGRRGLDTSFLRKAEQEDTGRIQHSKPFFRSRTKIGVFFATFLIFLCVEVAVVYIMYSNSRNAIAEAQGKRLLSVAEAADAAVGSFVRRKSPQQVIDSMLWRIRESNHLEEIVILDGDGRVMASTWGASRGTPSSVFATSPDVVRRAFQTGKEQKESISILGVPYRRVYYPIKHEGSVLGVLFIDAYDTLPEALEAIERPFWLGIAASFAGALALGVLMMGLTRLLEKTRREILSIERLATAGELAASIAHEVKNPLSTILSTTQLLQLDETMAKESRDFLQAIEEEVRRATDHLDSFLDLARDMPLKCSREDIREIVSSTAELFAAKGRQAGVEVRTILPPDPLHADVDRRKLRQVLANLLLNSVEALTGRTGGFITITASRTGEPESVTIEIKDNGPGVPEDIQDTVFEPFFSTKQSGTGLGLAQARQVIGRHGGTIELSSSPGKGTLVTLKLRAAEKGVQDADTDSR